MAICLRKICKYKILELHLIMTAVAFNFPTFPFTKSPLILSGYLAVATGIFRINKGKLSWQLYFSLFTGIYMRTLKSPPKTVSDSYSKQEIMRGICLLLIIPTHPLGPKVT